MKKYAEELAKDYELEEENEYGFFQYIVESLINGNPQQVKNLFNEIHKESQQDFLINFLDVKNGYHKSVLNICIIELT